MQKNSNSLLIKYNITVVQHEIIIINILLYFIGFTGGKVLKDKSNIVDETENTTTDLQQTIKSHSE